jgi:hypothetical protein
MIQVDCARRPTVRCYKSVERSPYHKGKDRDLMGPGIDVRWLEIDVEDAVLAMGVPFGLGQAERTKLVADHFISDS